MSTDDADAVGDGEPLDEEEQRELIRLAKKLGVENPKEKARSVSRRGVLASAGATGAAAMLGFSTGKARAQESQTETGTIGNGNQDADLQDVTAQSVSAESLNNTQYASNNEDSLPDLTTALSNATEGDTIVLTPGTHDISSEQTIENRITLVLLGTLRKQADVVALRFNEYAAIYAPGQQGRSHIQSAVSDSTAGIVYHYAVAALGKLTVDGVGGHGHHLHQATTDHNLNGMRTEHLRAVNNGLDGIRIENTSGDPSECNAQRIGVGTTFGNGQDGFARLAGFGNLDEITNTEANTGKGYRLNAAENRGHIIHAEANGEDVFVDANATGNRVTGNFGSSTNQNTITNIVNGRNQVKSFRATANVGPNDLVDLEVMIDTNGRLCFSDGSGNAWYVSGNPL